MSAQGRLRRFAGAPMNDRVGWKADRRLRMRSAEWLTPTYRRGDPGRNIVSCAASQCGIMPCLRARHRRSVERALELLREAS
jgi:hypothetical protein